MSQDLETEEMGIHQIPTPPLSENGDMNAKENENIDNNKNDNSTFEENLATALTQALKDPVIEKKGQLPPPPATTKKRGRPTKSSRDTIATPKAKKPKAATAATPTNANTTVSNTEKKRGRQAGTTVSDSFTKEQDDYIRELYTSTDGKKNSLKDIHAKFEERFETRKSINTIRFRWYKLKEDAIVLTTDEEAALKQAIETVETNKTQAILNEYHNKNEEFTRLSQGFVVRKMKEWSASANGGNSNSNINNIVAGKGEVSSAEEGGEEDE
ncbi:hypothetical protein TWF730_010187 [Orbilia blumenaviensis]|uniref:Myb-like domain-containing protein n=1 Tax=Orbilia blumenaviensis TaxID=1796055 RepID=A0AAV9UNC1_9PEZI